MSVGINWKQHNKNESAKVPVPAPCIPSRPMPPSNKVKRGESTTISQQHFYCFSLQQVVANQSTLPREYHDRQGEKKKCHLVSLPLVLPKVNTSATQPPKQSSQALRWLGKNMNEEVDVPRHPSLDLKKRSGVAFMNLMTCHGVCFVMFCSCNVFEAIFVFHIEP